MHLLFQQHVFIKWSFLYLKKLVLFVCLDFFLVSLVDWKLINTRILEKFNKFAQEQYAMAKNVYEYESDETVTLTIFKNAIKWITCIFTCTITIIIHAIRF